MQMLTSASVTSPSFLPGGAGHQLNDHHNLWGCDPAKRSTQLRTINLSREPIKLSFSCPAGLGSKLNLSVRTRHNVPSKQLSSVVCSAALNARCASTSGQTATITQKAPTITQAPVHENSPKLDDGDSGFPPRDDGDGGGGGGGGGGNWSGGFFLFGFLAFLGFLKDKESDEDYRDGRR